METKEEWEYIGAYDELLDEVYEVVKFGTLEYQASTVLKEVDPIAYRQGLLDFHRFGREGLRVKVWTVIRDTSGDWGAEGPFIIVAEGDDVNSAIIAATDKLEQALDGETIDVEEETYIVAVFEGDLGRSLVDGYGVIV